MNVQTERKIEWSQKGAEIRTDTSVYSKDNQVYVYYLHSLLGKMKLRLDS